MYGFEAKLASGSELGLALARATDRNSKAKENFISSYKGIFHMYPHINSRSSFSQRTSFKGQDLLMRGREFWMKDLYIV